MRQRPGQRVITQAPHIHHRDIGGNGWFGIGRKKIARLNRVTVHAQPDLEGLLHTGGRSPDIHDQTIRVGADHFKPLAFQKSTDLLILLFRGAEAGGEFTTSKELMKICATRIVQLMQEIIQLGLMVQRQANGQLQFVGLRQQSFGCQLVDNIRYMAMQAVTGNISGPNRQRQERDQGNPRELAVGGEHQVLKLNSQ